MFQNILATTDNSKKQDVVVLSAARIAAQNDAKLHILHVLASPPIETPPVRSGNGSSDGAIVDTMGDTRSVEEELRHTYRDLTHDPDHCTVKAGRGTPSREITRYAERTNVDLIVMGPPSSHAREQRGDRLTEKAGSNLKEVIMQAESPVMIIKALIPESALNFKKIVVGIDFSASCERALKYAVELANAFDSKVLPFHMVPVPPIPEYSQADYDADLASAQSDLFSFCAEILTSTAHEFHIWGGAHPHLEILKLTERNDADLIVMGSHTKEDQGKWYPGSAVVKVGARSICPTLVMTHSPVLKLREGALRLEKPA